MSMTREEIQSLAVGETIQDMINGRYGVPRRITRIFARGVSVKGHAYVCGYTEFGPTSNISFSISEDECFYRKVSA